MAIIVKISGQEFDADSLLSCDAEYKRLAHLAVETHIRIPYAIPAPKIDPERVSVWPPGVLNTLKKFSNIEHATVEFCVNNPSSRPLLRWRSNSSGFILLHAQKIVDDTEGKPTFQTATEMTYEETLALDNLKKHCVSDSKFRVQYFHDLLDIFPNIKRIRGLDSEKWGIVVLEEEAITHLRIKIPWVCEVVDIEDTMEDSGRNMTWKALAVKLPLSGYRMEEVVLDLTRINGVSDESMAHNCFEEADYSQLAMTLTRTRACSSTLSTRGKFHFVEF